MATNELFKQKLPEQLLDALSSGTWSRLVRIVPLICHAQKTAIQFPSIEVANVRSPGVLYLTNPFRISQFSRILLALDWNQLSSATNVSIMILNGMPIDKWNNLPLDSQIIAEQFILISLFLMIHHNEGKSSGLDDSIRSQLLSRINNSDLPIIRCSKLSPGAWKSTFSNRSLRLSPDTLFATIVYEWELFIHAALDNIRTSYYEQQGFLNLEKLSLFLNKDPKSAKTISQALATSYYTVLQYANVHPAIAYTNLEFLAILSNDLPVVWLNPHFVQILIKTLDHLAGINSPSNQTIGYIKQSLILFLTVLRRSDIDELFDQARQILYSCIQKLQSRQLDVLASRAALVYIALLARTKQSISLNAIHDLTIVLKHAYTTEEMLSELVLLIPKCDQPSKRQIFKSLFCSLHSDHSTLDSIENPSFEELVLLVRLLTSSELAITKVFEAELCRISNIHYGWTSWLMCKPKLSLEWTLDIIEAVLAIDCRKLDATPTDDTLGFLLHERELFAVVGLLEALVCGKNNGESIPSMYIHEIAKWIILNLHFVDQSNLEKVSFAFSRAMNAFGGSTSQDILGLAQSMCIDANFKQVVVLSLDMLLTHSECMPVYTEMVGDSKVTSNSTITASNASTLSKALSMSVCLLWKNGDTKTVSDFYSRVFVQTKDCFEHWKKFPLSQYTLETVPAECNAAYDIIFKKFQRSIMLMLALFGGIGSISAEYLQNRMLHQTPIPNVLLDTVAVSVQAMSNLHFIISQFGIDGVSLWVQLMDTFCDILSYSQFKSIQTLEICAPKSKANLANLSPIEQSQSLFYLLLAGRLIKALDGDYISTCILPIAHSYIFQEKNAPPFTELESTASALDLFDSAHSVYLKLFECSFLHRSLVCQIAPDYADILLKLFPKFMDYEALCLCFNVTMKGFGETFFANPAMHTGNYTNKDEFKHDLHIEMPINNTGQTDLKTASDTQVEHFKDTKNFSKYNVGCIDLPTRYALETQAETASRKCISLLLDAIHQLTEIHQDSPNALHTDSPTACDAKSKSSQSRLESILATSKPTAMFLQRNQLIMLLLDQLHTVSLAMLPGLMQHISDLFIESIAVSMDCVSLLESPLWQSLFKTVSGDTMIDYTRRVYTAEWYMRLYKMATRLIKLKKQSTLQKLETPLTNLQLSAKL
ncbi:hypothetical protein BDV3_006862 [Batrachochytrium dendrobatidis]|uniref:Uncharacterized protein n=1 Tax=Batrachochytrium dendrobatidis (strain JEL423) TaxID=403673 RepID=A0A177WT01_BATDL|nr:hypothetical protein BDEG_26188 [Batrachochytrium dendrobatidis JEL423]